MARQPARTEHEARHRYIDFLGLPLKCITKAIWVATPPLAPPQGEWSLHISGKKGGDPIRLRRDDDSLIYLTALQRFRPRQDETGAWRMRTLEYNYTVWEALPDRSLKPVLQWHFHPSTGTTSDTPHLHVRTSEFLCGLTTRRLHIPTERVAFEVVVRFLIEEMAVKPTRKDWSDVIDEALEAFVKHRSWTTKPTPDVLARDR